MTDKEQTPDERALAALFASLVEGSPPSEVSPLEVIKLGSRQNGADLDRRIRRLKIARNVLVAAVIAGVVVLVVPHLGGGSSTTSAANSSTSASSSEALAAAAAPASRGAGSSDFGSPQAGGAVSAPMASSAAGVAANSAAGRSAAAAGSSSAASAPAGSVPAGPAPAATEAAGSGGASSGSVAPSSAPGGLPVDSSGSGCVVLPEKAVAAIRAVFAAGYFGAAAAAPGCESRYGVRLPVSADPGASLTIRVNLASPGVCDSPRSPVAVCSPVAGSPGAFRQKLSGPTTKFWVYGLGYEVILDTADARLGGSADKVIAAGHAVAKSLG